MCLTRRPFRKKGAVPLSVAAAARSKREDISPCASRSGLTVCYGAARGHGLSECRQPDQHLACDPLPETDGPVLPEPRRLRHRVQGAALRLEDHRGHQVSETRQSRRGKVQDKVLGANGFP